MSGFLCKTLRRSATDVQNSSFLLDVVSLVLVRGLSSSTKKISKAAGQRKKASTFRKVHSESPEGTPVPVVGFLKNHGFSYAQISKLITSLPRLVSCDPEQTLLPKVEFFNSIGITGPAFTRILTQVPQMWFRSVIKGLAPCYDFIKSVVFSEDRAVASLKRAPRILMSNMQNSIAPNIASLRKFGVTQPVVSFLVSCYPNLLLQANANFEKHVREALGMGFDPKTSAFVHALRVFVGTTKLTQERKKVVFRRFGWSDDEILLALKTNPMFLLLSEKKISDGLNFLMNKMGWQRDAVARVPMVLCYSLNNRVIPRLSVVQVLQSEGLLNEDIHLSSVLIPTEKTFLARFVIKYEEQAPQLLNLYKGKLGVRE